MQASFLVVFFFNPTSPTNDFSFPTNSCREFITGFRKRKQQRRKEALGNLEKKQRQQRIEERAEVSKILKHKITAPL